MKTALGCGSRRRSLGILLVLAWFAGRAYGQHIPRGWRQFVSVKGGYIAYFPKSWHLLEPGLPTLDIANFPPSRMVRAVVVPDGGATISIVPPPQGVTTIEQWVGRDSRVTRVQSRRSITLQVPDSTEPLGIEEVIYLSTEGPDTVSWYFGISGRLLVANLSYWFGDPNATKFREVLREVVQTVRPLER
jgi:hypothetical protein